jgi:hypothetical protein
MNALLTIAIAAVLGPGFHGRAAPIDAQTRARMSGVSWHSGCPVGFSDLRLLCVTHWGFDGRAHRGRLVVHRDAAAQILGAMCTLYRRHFPIRRSMAADNTSAFNCRVVAGTSRWSEHAFGRAIDLNPVENPYVTDGGYVSPPAGAPFAHRSRHRKGMVGGRVVRAFAAVGWGWGGNWAWPKDFQHFSASGH